MFSADNRHIFESINDKKRPFIGVDFSFGSLVMNVIKPLHMCNMQREKSLFTYNTGFGELVWIAVQAWLVVGSKEGPILVDTGAPAHVVQGRDHKKKVVGIKTLEELLRERSYSFLDVKTVIMTHLHYDHTGNLQHFRHARVLAQKDEVDAAFDPHPLQRGFYEKRDLEGVNFTTCEGEKEIAPGVRVIPVYGHSAGTQAVEIETRIGNVIISGSCSINENFYPSGSSGEITIQGIHLDSLGAFESMLKIKKRADIIIPVHDVDWSELENIPGE
jgi:glyoxylase-like metal-dependent hydrolase (beta-lactamase superfamily II)